MAGYKPKSLEELNSLYDKSKNVKNEIAQKAYILGEGAASPAAEAPVEAEAPVKEPADGEIASGEQITGLVDDFIKSFGEPVAVKKVRPTMVTAAAVKPLASAKIVETKVPAKETAPVQPVQPVLPEKPKLIRSSERNELFEDYKKVMDDEDDYEYSRHKLGKRRGKKLFEKKSAAVNADASEESAQPLEQINEPEAQAVQAEADVSFVQQENAEAALVSSEADFAEIPETLENIDAVIEKVLGRPVEAAAQEIEAEAPVSEEAYEAEPVIEEPYQEPYEEPYEQAVESYPEEAEQPSEPYYEEEKAEEAYEEAEQQAYTDSAEASEANEAIEAIEAPKAEKTAPVKVKSSAKGNKVKNLLLVAVLFILVIATAISGIKAFAGINSDNIVGGGYHLYSAQADYAQAGIKKGDLVLVAHEAVEEGKVFAYKAGNGSYSFAMLDSVLNEESIVADVDGQKSIVFKNTVRGVIEKIYPGIGTIAAIIASYYLYITGGLLVIAAALILVIIFAFRKKKAEAEEAFEQDNAFGEGENVYEDVEGDFMYLIQEENGEEDFDVYRQEYSQQEDEEALPVIGNNYKYEPDEYVNN